MEYTPIILDIKRNVIIDINMDIIRLLKLSNFTDADFI